MISPVLFSFLRIALAVCDRLWFYINSFIIFPEPLKYDMEIFNGIVLVL